MPNLAEDQLRRLLAAAEDIQMILRELTAADAPEAEAAEPLVRCASASSSFSATALDDDIIVDGEPE
jgi:hypothetical protein